MKKGRSQHEDTVSDSQSLRECVEAKAKQQQQQRQNKAEPFQVSSSVNDAISRSDTSGKKNKDKGGDEKEKKTSWERPVLQRQPSVCESERSDASLRLKEDIELTEKSKQKSHPKKKGPKSA